MRIPGGSVLESAPYAISIMYAFIVDPSPPPQVSTFIMMYRTHCQRILDTVIRANFDEVGQ